MRVLELVDYNSEKSFMIVHVFGSDHLDSSHTLDHSLDRDENDHQEEGLTQGDDGHAQSRPGIMHQFLDIHTRSFSHHEQLVFFVLFCIFLFLSLLFV